jgi:hypothetical protein
MTKFGFSIQFGLISIMLYFAGFTTGTTTQSRPESSFQIVPSCMVVYNNYSTLKMLSLSSSQISFYSESTTKPKSVIQKQNIEDSQVYGGKNEIRGAPHDLIANDRVLAPKNHEIYDCSYFLFMPIES